MAGTGVITAVAAVNTVETITQQDTHLSDVITTVSLTANTDFNTSLLGRYRTSYREGYFGIPKKIKFPESTMPYEVTPAQLENGAWQATKGVAHTFLAGEPVQKVFGEALIYMRYNTPTTKNIGSIMSGDMINIVTTQGWQLSYKVNYLASDPSTLTVTTAPQSKIIVILIDDQTGKQQSISASLLKVGERI